KAPVAIRESATTMASDLRTANGALIHRSYVSRRALPQPNQAPELTILTALETGMVNDRALDAFESDETIVLHRPLGSQPWRAEVVDLNAAGKLAAAVEAMGRYRATGLPEARPVPTTILHAEIADAGREGTPAAPPSASV